MTWLTEKLGGMGIIAAPLSGDSSKDDRKEVMKRLQVITASVSNLASRWIRLGVCRYSQVDTGLCAQLGLASILGRIKIIYGLGPIRTMVSLVEPASGMFAADSRGGHGEGRLG